MSSILVKDCRSFLLRCVFGIGVRKDIPVLLSGQTCYREPSLFIVFIQDFADVVTLIVGRDLAFITNDIPEVNEVQLRKRLLLLIIYGRIDLTPKVFFLLVHFVVADLINYLCNNLPFH